MEPIPDQTLRAIEQHLYSVIRERTARMPRKYVVPPLPSLTAMMAGEESQFFRRSSESEVWIFHVPGMYGGFRLRWMPGGPEPKLESVSFCRVASGSAQRHEITAEGGVLVEPAKGRE